VGVVFVGPFAFAFSFPQVDGSVVVEKIYRVCREREKRRLYMR